MENLDKFNLKNTEAQDTSKVKEEIRTDKEKDNAIEFKQEAYKELFFASAVENTEKAVNFYKLKRQEIQTNPNLKSEEKLDLMRYCDTERAIRIVEDEAEYKKYFNEHHNTSMEISFSKGLQSALLKIFSKEHLIFGPNVVFIAPEAKPIMGLSFSASIDGVKYYDPTNTKIRLDMVIVDSNRPNIEHNGSVYIDKQLNDIRSVIIPEGLHTSSPEALVQDSFSVPTVETESMLAIANLSRKSEYEPEQYKDKKVNSINLGSPKETKLIEKIKSVLPFRRRTIKDINQLPNQLNNLLNNFSSKEIKILENIGGGDVLIDVYCRWLPRLSQSGAPTRDKHIPDGLIGSARAGNLASLESLVRTAISNQGKAIILPKGEWIPPQVLSTPKRPHTRRIGGEIHLYIGNSIPKKERDEIHRIWRKRKIRELQDLEKKTLDNFLKKYNISKDVNADLKFVNGIHYKDGRFIPSVVAEDHKQVYTR